MRSSTIIDNPRNVVESDFPYFGTEYEKLHYCLNYAVQSPSSHNTQPWLFRIDDAAVELFIDRTRRLPVADPLDRELTISCGAALFLFRLALRYFGLASEVDLLPDRANSDLLARVRLGGSYTTTGEDQRLFHAIPRRQTNRQPYQDREVPESIVLDLVAAAETEGAWLHIIKDVERTVVAGLVAEGDRIHWMRSILPPRTGVVDPPVA